MGQSRRSWDSLNKAQPGVRSELRTFLGSPGPDDLEALLDTQQVPRLAPPGRGDEQTHPNQLMG